MRCLLAFLLASAAVQAASLYTAETLADGTLFSDQVARRTGDLITISILESTKISDNEKTETKRTNDASAAISMLPGVTELPATEGAASVHRLPAVKLGSDKSFKGEGKFEATGEVRTMITGRVIDVLDNGNLVVEGRRAVTVGADTKTILVAGIVRRADVRSDNTVLSEKMHAFQVSIAGDGPIARSQEQGFLGRVVDAIWPF